MQNGKSTNENAVHQYKKTSFKAGQILPDAPEGGWEATCLKGKTRVKPTKDGDPMVSFVFRLDTADDDKNEHAQGTQLTKRIILANETSKLPAFAKRRTKMDLRALAEACGFDLDIIPENLVEDGDDQETVEAKLRPFIEAVEGQTMQVWTTHRDDKRNPGQKDVEIHFSKPGAAYGAPTTLSSRDNDDE